MSSRSISSGFGASPPRSGSTGTPSCLHSETEGWPAITEDSICFRQPQGGTAISTTDSALEQVLPLEEPPSTPETPSEATPEATPRVRARRKRPSKRLIAILLLSVALAAALAVLALYLIELDDANTLIEEQQRQLEEQQHLIEKKETFGAAMHGLMDTAGQFNGVLLTSLIPLDHYQMIASRAWTHRWNPDGMDRDTAEVRTATRDLEDLLSGASAEAATNTSGTTYEAVIDKLGGGFVTSLIDDADTLCEADVLACVSSNDPLTVHFDVAEISVAYMTDWLHTGVAYHEYAHVLQMMNPVPTETALESFGGDDETMADCFALTYLDGWTLDHRIWMNRYEYWDVNIGYGHTCDDVQRQAVRDWYGQLPFQLSPITQQG